MMEQSCILAEDMVCIEFSHFILNAYLLVAFAQFFETHTKSFYTLVLSLDAIITNVFSHVVSDPMGCL